jgi:hypothetical protein
MTTPEITTGLASQSGHWYAADGSPAYEIPAKNGALRPVTLRDARKHNLYPSVTTVLGVAAKPALEAWKVRQGILAALTLPMLEGETDDAFAERALADSREQSRRAAALGTLLHEQIERSFTGTCDPEWLPFVQPVRDWLSGTFGDVQWAAEHSFANSLGFGGKVDLFSRSRSVVIDFKTKDFDAEKAADVKGYDEQGVQLAAYAHGLGLDSPMVPMRVNLFVSTRVPGLIVPHVWSEDTYDRHLAMFMALLAYWQADKGYSPKVPK